MSVLAHLLALPVRAYRLVFSPWVGFNCRYQPTCSQYALEALGKAWGAQRRVARRPAHWAVSSLGPFWL
jgi:putative component of membrane protein insertase Oxa1/YidC/SpoIIIJ protein YidD